MEAVVWRRSRAQLVEVARTGDLPLQIGASHRRGKEQRPERDGEHQAAGASRDGAVGLDLPSHRGKKHGR
jgi:hypothetical protein